MLKTRVLRLVGILGLCILVLAGCGASQGESHPDTNVARTATPISSPTAPPATPALTTTSFTCPATVSGAQKTFSDSSMRFSFVYPAAWTESSCQRITANAGQQALFIGNLFSVSSTPRDGQSIQQWVSAQTNQYEVVTLGTLSVPHAQAAVTVSVLPSATPDPNKPFDAEPFSSTLAIVAGPQYFYTINGFVAQMSMTDTMPGLSNAQLAQQIVTSFTVA